MVNKEGLIALGMVETKEALPALFAADAAAKAAFVHVAEVNTGKGIGGKGYFTVNGEVELRRGRQLHDGDVVELGGMAATVRTPQDG